jgi:hypothetical protein
MCFITLDSQAEIIRALDWHRLLKPLARDLSEVLEDLPRKLQKLSTLHHLEAASKYTQFNSIFIELGALITGRWMFFIPSID